MSAEPTMQEQLLARFLQHETSGLRRLTIEIAGEQVALYMRDGRLRENCTCGVSSCEHVRVVMQFLVSGAAQIAPSEVRVRSSMRPPAHEPVPRQLHDAFRELCLATARAGIATPDSPSIKQALAQLRAAAPSPLPVSFARWVGRFQQALVASEAGELTRLLDGALGWLEHAQEEGNSVDALAQRRLWLGPSDGASAGPAHDSLAEATLLEVAREWVSGLDRAAIERRYLVDLASGEIFREERCRGETEISVGPCPRYLQVAFAEVESATRPRRARLLQYTLSLQVPEAPWQRVIALAHAEVEGLRERYAAEVRACPALAEPFAIFAPADLDRSGAALTDARGERVALRNEDGQSGLDGLLAATRGSELVCVLGRLLGRAAGLVLHPLSAIVRRGDWLELRRVT